MYITWEICVPYNSPIKNMKDVARRISEDALRSSLPPNKVIIKREGYGDYLFDILNDEHSLPVVLSQ